MNQLSAPSGGLRVVSAPSAPGQGGLWEDQFYELEADDGWNLQVRWPEYVEYVYYSQNGKLRQIEIPPTAEEAASIIKIYLTYISSVKANLRRAIFDRVLSGNRADEILSQVLAQNHIQEGPIRLKPKVSKSPTKLPKP